MPIQSLLSVLKVQHVTHRIQVLRRNENLLRLVNTVFSLGIQWWPLHCIRIFHAHKQSYSVHRCVALTSLKYTAQTKKKIKLHNTEIPTKTNAS